MDVPHVVGYFVHADERAGSQRMNFASKLFFTLRDVSRHPLNRRGRLRAAFQFCVAQVAVRRIPGEVSVEFPNGTRLLIPPHMKGAAHFITPGLCEFDEMGFVLHFLRAADLLVDVGANVGAYTVLASGVRQARTICFEPSPSTFQFLRKNILLNEISHLARPVNAALGKANGEIRLTETLGTENYVCLADQAGSGVVVPLRRLDDELAAEQPTLIKVDVEGFETDVFAGAAQTLARPSLAAMIVERNGMGSRYNFDEAVLHKTIRGHGFVPCAYHPLERSLRRVEDNAQGNIIYVRDMTTAAERLRTAEPVRFRSSTV